MDTINAVVMPTKRGRNYVEFFYTGHGDDPFICGVDGHFTAEVLEAIEKDFLSEGSDCFNKGAGSYLFRVEYVPAQKGEYGMIEVAEWWELTEVLFEPLGA